MKVWIQVLSIAAIALVVTSCKKEKESKEEKVTRHVSVPKFNADSAYQFVETQVKFGPRVPGTSPHKKAADYFINQFKKYGARVTEQNFEATTFDGQRLQLKNIIASYHEKATKRILLAAHWDTRPFADKDTENQNAAFDGANDGASGAAVLLEIARVLSSNASPAVGVDIILFDGEDWGERDDRANDVPLPAGLESWWCLGSQHWAKNKHVKNYSAYFGILLDMVGAKRSQFYREETSLYFAPKIVEKVWNAAEQIGYSDYFVKQNVAGITDDHLFVNKLANIPMIDIVHYQAGIGFFGDYHHSRKDNLSIISKESLNAVGATLLHVVYYEEP